MPRNSGSINQVKKATNHYQTSLLASDFLQKPQGVDTIKNDDEVDAEHEEEDEEPTSMGMSPPKDPVTEEEIAIAAMSGLNVNKHSDSGEVQDSAALMQSFRARNAKKATKQKRREERAEKRREQESLDRMDGINLEENKVKKPVHNNRIILLNKPAAPVGNRAVVTAGNTTPSGRRVPICSDWAENYEDPDDQDAEMED